MTAYKTHGYIRSTPILAAQIKKETNIKRDNINAMNIINDDDLFCIIAFKYWQCVYESYPKI